MLRYLVILIICVLGISCTSESSKNPSPRGSLPLPAIDDEEIIVLLPCRNPGQGNSFLIYDNNGLNPEALKIQLETQTSLTPLNIADFYGNADTVGGQSTNFLLCEVVFDTPLVKNLHNDVVVKFENALCSIFGITACNPFTRQAVPIVVGPNIVYGTDPRKSNDPTCTKETFERLMADANTAQNISETGLRNLLGVSGSPFKGNGVNIVIFDTGGPADNLNHSRNLTIDHWPIDQIDRVAEANFADDYKCEIVGAPNGHGSIVSKIINVVAPKVERTMIKTCNFEGDCLGADIVKGLLGPLNGFFSAPAAINMSFGTAELPPEISPTGDDPVLRYLLEEMQSSMPNTIVGASAGNNATKKGIPHYPASHEADLNNVLAVGASKLPIAARARTNSLVAAGFTSPVTNFLAPAVNHLKSKGNTGTSFAAPGVVGLVALYTEANGPTPASNVRAALKGACVPSGPYCLAVLP